ncbi:unnamed protein product [Adineta ricciae]|uniref:Uncharacterized protein n=1 Tax=Adineta ricciae TaxID=249248 RepID=A0A816DH22_ADIRI|nr:unnamed protein product [Adineta ricciae]
MSLILIHNDQTVPVELPRALDEYCCLFDEICKTIISTFKLNNLICDYHLTYYDPLYKLWINLNIHVTKRITEILRESSAKTLKIQIQRRQNLTTYSIKTKKFDHKLSNINHNDQVYVHTVIWLDESIGNPYRHNKFKRDCWAMINANTVSRFADSDNIDAKVRYDTYADDCERIWRHNSQYTTTKHMCPFQCHLFTADSTYTFFTCLNTMSKLTRSLSIIVSMQFAKEVIPIVLYHQQKQLIPSELFLYVFDSNIESCYDWASYYTLDDHLPQTTTFLLFDDKKQLFIRLLNEIRRLLVSEADAKRAKHELCSALQYYCVANQLFLNSLRWNHRYTFAEFDRLNRVIDELERDVNEVLIEKFKLSVFDNRQIQLSDELSQECSEIFEGL